MAAASSAASTGIEPGERDGHRERDADRDHRIRRVAGLSAAMRGLSAAPTAVMTAVAAIDADIRRMTRASTAACRRLMTVPGVGQLTALAFAAAIDDPSRIRRSRDIGAYLGLVPRRYQSGEMDYVGSISKCGDRRVRTLLYEAANVMLTRYKRPTQAQGLGLRHRQAINDAECLTSTQRTQAPESVDIRKSLPPWPIRKQYPSTPVVRCARSKN